MTAWGVFCQLSGVAAAASLAAYLLPLLALALLPRRRAADAYPGWAVVTGGSGGIGAAVAARLAAGGASVVLVARDEPALPAAAAALRAAHPRVQVRTVAVDLSTAPEAYMAAVRAATDDVPVGLLVNNAGYLRMGYFDELGVDAQIANVECNVLAAVRLTHHFYTRMVAERRRGCIAFTSSAAWFLPAPYAAIYASSKTMLSHFAASLAIEARNHNVDVTVVHPSYTHTGLYDGQPRLGVLQLLARFGWTPEEVADALIDSLGRVVVRDIGAYSVATNIFGRLVDAGALALAIIPFRSTVGPPPRRP